MKTPNLICIKWRQWSIDIFTNTSGNVSFVVGRHGYENDIKSYHYFAPSDLITAIDIWIKNFMNSIELPNFLDQTFA